MTNAATAARRVVEQIDALASTRGEYMASFQWLDSSLPQEGFELYRTHLFSHCLWSGAGDDLMDCLANSESGSLRYLLYPRADVLKMAFLVGLQVFSEVAPQLLVASYKSLVAHFGADLSEVRWLISRASKSRETAASLPGYREESQVHCPQQVGLAYFLRAEIVPEPLIPFLRRRLGVGAYVLHQFRRRAWLLAEFDRKRPDIETMLSEYVNKFNPG